MPGVKSAKSLEFTVPQECDGTLLGAFLHKTKSVSQRIIRNAKRMDGGITSDGVHIRTIDTVRAGQRIKILLPKPQCDMQPEDIPLDIVYEDEHYLLINKGSNMPVHPTSSIHVTDTMANGVAYYMRRCGDLFSISIVNRLDKDTSGLVLIAKNAYAAENAAKTARKKYFAVCSGELRQSGRIDAPIARCGDSIITRCVDESGARAVTNYEPLKIANGRTLAAIRLETGRTHQIRVHFSYIGHSLEGDDLYGGSLDNISRQALHCGELSFYHPMLEKRLEFSSPLPEDMARLIEI
ncbi:MAG: RluA family pseudouridine synthase [Acutalibacteraceae bacterium]